MGIDFEWDPNKAARNLQKQAVSLEEAATVFRDDLSISVPDPDHSLEEERFITVLVLLAPDVAAVFPDEKAVNEALRLVMQLARIPRPDRHGVVEP